MHFVKKRKIKDARGAKVNYSKSGVATILKRQILEFKSVESILKD